MIPIPYKAVISALMINDKITLVIFGTIILLLIYNSRLMYKKIVELCKQVSEINIRLKVAESTVDILKKQLHL